MKKIIILLLFNFGSFAQVFDLDTTFRFEAVKKKYDDNSASVSQLPNGLVFLFSQGSIFNGEQKESNRFLVDEKGKIKQTIDSKSKLNFNYRSESDIITPDNKFITRDNTVYPSYKLARYFSNGNLDSTFNFPSYNDFIYKTFLLHNNNLMVVLTGYSPRYYHIFDTNGKLIKIFDLEQYGYDKNARLDNLVFNEFNEYFLLILNNEGNGEVIKTNANFEIDKNFVKVKYKRKDAYIIKLEQYKNENIIYRTSLDTRQISVEKIDRYGKLINLLNFDDISQYGISSFPEIYYQNDKSIGFIFPDKKHVKILPNWTIDSTFYNNSRQKNIEFLHVFADGTYWIIQNKSGIIEKMYANGSIDTDFKIRLQYEKLMYPSNIQKIGNNNYVVNFTDLEFYYPPTVVQNSSNPNCIRVYNNKHQLIHDFFDAKTIWKSDIISNSILIRGNNTIIKIDSMLNMALSKDTLSTSDVIDLKNNFIYRITKGLVNETSIKRFKIGVGLDKDFSINGEKIIALKLLNDGRIAVKKVLNLNAYNYNFCFEIYKADGKKDTSVKQISLNSNFFFSDQYLNAGDLTINYDDGFIITLTSYSPLGSIYRGFAKFDNYGNPDTNFQKKLMLGGQYLKYSKDGSIYSNSAQLFETNGTTTYNFLKIAANSKIDSTFSLNGSNTIYGFDFFDENTIYASDGKTIIRFIKNPTKKAETFYFEPLPSKITWDYALPLKINIKTTLKNLKISVSGNGFLKDSLIYIASKVKGGSIFVEVVNSDNKRIAYQNISITGIIPSFIYEEPKLTMGSLPYTFSVKSTSNLPVNIYVYGSKYENEAILFPDGRKYIEIRLVSEGNNQYETIEKTFNVSIGEPLANEQTESIKFYPNPVSEILTIENQNLKIESIKLFNISGKEESFSIIEEFDKLKIQLKHLSTGMYFLKLSNSQKQFFQKIWVE